MYAVSRFCTAKKTKKNAEATEPDCCPRPTHGEKKASWSEQITNLVRCSNRNGNNKAYDVETRLDLTHLAADAETNIDETAIGYFQGNYC